MNKLTLLAWALKLWLLIGQWLLAQGPLGVLPPPMPPPPNVAPGGLRLEHELVRRNRGLPDFAKNDTLTQLAQEHAEYMQRRGGATHLGAGNLSLWDRANRVGYAYVGLSECVTAGQPDARQAVAAWLGSAGNRENVLSAQWTEVGYGTAGRYYVAIYARPAGARAAATVRQSARRTPALSQWRSVPQPQCQRRGR